MSRIVPSQVVALIEAVYPRVKSDTENKPFTIEPTQSPQIAAILDLATQLPAELVLMHPNQHTEYLCSISALREVLQAWRDRRILLFDRVPGLRHLNPVTLIWQALKDCPDEFPAPGTTELNFVADETLRNSLRLDISSANSALVNREWKAATVLAGSVVEALLLWAIGGVQPEKTQAAIQNLLAIKELPRQPDRETENWGLFQLRLVAAELKLIKERTVKQIELAQNFRNLIHPGRTQRLGEVCSRGTAMAAIAATEFVMEDLSS